MILIIILSSLLHLINGSFFDVCPYGTMSLGECISGLCPNNAKCFNNYCCAQVYNNHKRRVNRIDPVLIGDIEKIRKKKGGPCYIEGNEPIGVCLGDEVCPIGYNCENDSCCNEAESIRLSRRKKKKNLSEEDLIEDEKDIENSYEEITEDEEEEDKSKEEEEENEEEDRKRSEEDVEDEEDEDDNRSKERNRLTSNEVDEEDESDELLTKSRKGMRRYTAKRKEKQMIPDEADLAPTKNVCPVGYPIGECVSRLCPDGYSCYKNSCCVVTPEISCEDSLPKCHTYLCDIEGYTEFMIQYCAKTCAKCTVMKSAQHRTEIHSIPSKSRLDKSDINVNLSQKLGVRPELCTDRRSDCNEWISSGFCSSPIYSNTQKMKLCGHSCGFC